MSVSRRFVAAGAVSVAAVALAVSFTGVASGASAPALPSAIVTVHANPGQVSTEFVGITCGGSISVRAFGPRSGSGKVSCGTTSKSVAASPGGTLGSTTASPTQATLICQANARFASSSVNVVCKENAT